MSDRSAVVRAYAALLHLYPRRFREGYGQDMVALLQEQCRDEPTSRVAARALLDLAITIPTQHLETAMSKGPNRIVPFIYLAVAAAGVALAVAGGSEPSTFFIGLAVALVSGTVGAIAWRRSRPVTEASLDESLVAQWWKFLVAGPALVGAVILAAGAGVEAWLLGMAVVFVAVALTALGIVLGVVHAVGHHRGPSPA